VQNLTTLNNLVAGTAFAERSGLAVGSLMCWAPMGRATPATKVCIADLSKDWMSTSQ
jgi:hypothetical protein